MKPAKESDKTMKRENQTALQDQAEDTGYYREAYEKKTHIFPRIALLLLVMAPIALLMTDFLPEEDALSNQIALWQSGTEEQGESVGGAMDIETIWAIEDAREEAERPLVTRMYRDGAVLGFDEASRTFYCTLGLETGEEWPEIALSARGEEGVQVVWVDDHTYDWCSDAIADGYRYELMAYTDTQYEYIGLVFTGLPIVTLHADDGAEISWDTVSADFHLASAGEGESLYSHALVNRRGGGLERTIKKNSYHVELHTIDYKGRDKKRSESVLGMEADTDWLLVGSPGDRTTVRNQIGWDLWREWNGGEGITMLKGEMVELFVEDEYAGVYQLMQRIDADEELEKMGGSLLTDVVVRKVTSINDGDRPQWVVSGEEEYHYDLELRYAPEGMSAEEAFAIFEPFVAADVGVPMPLSDEEFEEIVLKHFDLRQLMEYFLYIQAMSLDNDSVNNNVYIWARLGEDGVYRYTITPWDVDNAFKLLDSDLDGEMNEMNLLMEFFNRILDLDIGGSRRLMREVWAEKKATVLEEGALYQRICDMEDMINASGAFLRESQKHQGGARPLDLSEMRAVAIGHQSVLEGFMDGLWPLEDGQNDMGE